MASTAIKEFAAADEGSVPAWEEIVKETQLLGTPGDDVDGGFRRDCGTIAHFLLYMLKRWEEELESREEPTKRSVLGRQETLTFKQTLASIKPLLDRLANYTCSYSIRLHLAHIIRSCVLERDYVKATNAYMEMSIGNAPWPVGVTRSGIHQRPASSKAYANEAHALNDETTRKYIHAVKRLMTKCQAYFPSAPSKSMGFIKRD